MSDAERRNDEFCDFFGILPINLLIGGVFVLYLAEKANIEKLRLAFPCFAHKCHFWYIKAIVVIRSNPALG
ncbi:hypothetical protein [Parageobacillus thermoglucosidasius]|nr:hypothetical protein [Parageobacillus thermoglucosidasius]MED4906100.1 hypothetical protein [Parageobacillus thermoglucosidasius]MED4983007.1 hypothetical protein [Parageobacillus thermoglucosidasius]